MEHKKLPFQHELPLQEPIWFTQNMAAIVNITAGECTIAAAPVTRPTVTPMKAPLRPASFPLYHGSLAALPPPDGAAAAGAAEPSPTTPKTASLERYLSMTSGGWIMLNSSVASLPAKVRIASSPP